MRSQPTPPPSLAFTASPLSSLLAQYSTHRSTTVVHTSTSRISQMHPLKPSYGSSTGSTIISNSSVKQQAAVVGLSQLFLKHGHQKQHRPLFSNYSISSPSNLPPSSSSAAGPIPCLARRRNSNGAKKSSHDRPCPTRRGSVRGRLERRRRTLTSTPTAGARGSSSSAPTTRREAFLLVLNATAVAGGLSPDLAKEMPDPSAPCRPDSGLRQPAPFYHQSRSDGCGPAARQPDKSGCVEVREDDTRPMRERTEAWAAGVDFPISEGLRG
jgi:hypothetical protein